jgi:hypothetical protein
MTLTNQNDIHDEIKRRLNSENAYYHLVQNLLSSHLISKELDTEICKTVILPVVLYGCHVTWVPCHHGMACPQVMDGGKSSG